MHVTRTVYIAAATLVYPSIEEVAEIINEHTFVMLNRTRNHNSSMWLAITAMSRRKLDRTIETIFSFSSLES